MTVRPCPYLHDCRHEGELPCKQAYPRSKLFERKITNPMPKLLRIIEFMRTPQKGDEVKNNGAIEVFRVCGGSVSNHAPA